MPRCRYTLDRTSRARIDETDRLTNTCWELACTHLDAYKVAPRRRRRRCTVLEPEPSTCLQLCPQAKPSQVRLACGVPTLPAQMISRKRASPLDRRPKVRAVSDVLKTAATHVLKKCVYFAHEAKLVTTFQRPTLRRYARASIGNTGRSGRGMRRL